MYKKEWKRKLILLYITESYIDAEPRAVTCRRTLASFSIRNFHVLNATFDRNHLAIAAKFCDGIHARVTARSWNFLNDALLELVVRERARVRGIQLGGTSYALLRFACISSFRRCAITVSIPRTFAGMHAPSCIFVPRNFSRSILRAADFTRYTAKPQNPLRRRAVGQL